MCTYLQKVSFLKLLEEILNKIPSQYITYFQFYLLIEQSNIKFVSNSQTKKYSNLFINNQKILKSMVKSIFQLKNVIIKNNKQYFCVKMPLFYVQHKNYDCFNWWKNFMLRKYGSQLRWFQIITKQMHGLSAKCYTFKQNLKQLLKGTQHQNCTEKICQFFTKNNKNEIQWPTFLNTIRNSNKHKILRQKTPIKKVFYKYNSTSKISQKKRQNKTVLDRYKTENLTNQNEQQIFSSNHKKLKIGQTQNLQLISKKMIIQSPMIKHTNQEEKYQRSRISKSVFFKTKKYL